MYSQGMTLLDRDISEAVDYLVFANYKHNRLISPDTPITSYMRIYPKSLVLSMEEKFLSLTSTKTISSS